MTGAEPRSPAADPPPELVARFKAALDRLWPESGRLGLAVSGGPDSLAMLLLAQAAIPGQFEVAAVDHGLRPESAGECAMVARVCAERGIRCEVLAVEVEPGNLQDAARDARYEGLAEWASRRGISAIATAHHADDQAETLLMRLNRGSGLAGLAGVRERVGIEGWNSPVIVRPLLFFRHAELAKVVEVSGIAPVNDPSNTDERFDRARIRKALLESNWIDPLALAASAAHLAEAEEALDWATSNEFTARVSKTLDRSQWPPAPIEIRYRYGTLRAIEVRIVKSIILDFGRQARGGDVARIVDRLYLGQGGNLGGVLGSVVGDHWVFRPEPPRQSR
jgi:tRNA(Ile)-lysidine synthase